MPKQRGKAKFHLFFFEVHFIPILGFENYFPQGFPLRRPKIVFFGGEVWF